MNLSLYHRLAELQGDEPWGAVLDAGTGPASLRWLRSLPCPRWTAVTASKQMAKKLADGSEDGAALDGLVVGNWLDPQLLAGETFDTVIADYLLGAIEGFAPYWQHQLFDRLRPLVGRRLYLIGLEPYVTHVPEDAAGRLVCEIGRLRDACLLLAGDRPYREYPLGWVMDHLARADFRILGAERVPIRYGERFITSQLDMCYRAVGKFTDRELAVAFLKRISALSQQATAFAEREGGLRHGYDYIVVAEPGRKSDV